MNSWIYSSNKPDSFQSSLHRQRNQRIFQRWRFEKCDCVFVGRRRRRRGRKQKESCAWTLNCLLIICLHSVFVLLLLLVNNKSNQCKCCQQEDDQRNDDADFQATQTVFNAFARASIEFIFRCFTLCSKHMFPKTLVFCRLW